MDDSLSPREVDRLVTAGGKFLRAASTRPAIMNQLLGLGYSLAEHQLGWEIYLKMLGYHGRTALPPASESSAPSQIEAMNRIDRYDEPAFRRARAALERLHPDQFRYVFGDGLAPKTGPESLGSVQTFLDRYAALRDGTDPARAAKKKLDKAAAATLEARNIVNPQIEKELRALLAVAQTLATDPVGMPTIHEQGLHDAALAFRCWLRDWRTTASAGITRRDYRIMLGISRRRSPSEAAEDVADDDAEGDEPAPAATS